MGQLGRSYKGRRHGIGRRGGNFWLLCATALAAGGCTIGSPPPAGTSTVTPRLSAILDGIKSCADAQAAADEFSGVVLVEQDGRQVLAQAYGMADPEKGIRNGLDTQFNTGSVAKMFTAVAVGQLVEAGKLRLEDEVGKYLPELPPHVARLTLAQLLSHRSGIGEVYREPDNLQRAYRARTARELMSLVAASRPVFEPGARREYSNTGPFVTGAVIEAVTGRSYADYVQRHIFRPAGMTGSTLHQRPADAAQMLTRSENMTGPLILNSDTRLPRRKVEAAHERGAPVGNAYNSAPDLAKFVRAMRNERILSRAMQQRLWGDRSEIPGAGEYAYGFMTSGYGNVLTVGHSGMRGGVSADVYWAPDRDWTVVVLANYDFPSGHIIANAARLSLTGAESPGSACEAARRGMGGPRPRGGA